MGHTNTFTEGVIIKKRFGLKKAEDPQCLLFIDGEERGRRREGGDLFVFSMSDRSLSILHFPTHYSINIYSPISNNIYINYFRA